MAAPSASPTDPGERNLGGIDRVLRWTLALTVVAVAGILVYATIVVGREKPPLPAAAVAPSGVVFTKDDVRDGKAVFQRTDLMDFGSLYGNGAYFGPDWGDDYLVRQARLVGEFYARDRFGRSYSQLAPAQRRVLDRQTRRELQANRYDEKRDQLALTSAQAAAHRALERHYRQLFLEGDRKLGMPKDTVRDRREADQLAAFFGWIAWTSVARRPGEDISYTNNWPYEPSVGNDDTSAMWWWTWGSVGGLIVLSLAVLLVYRRWIAVPRGAHRVPAAPLADAPLTPSQASLPKWLLLVPALLLLQGLVGALIAHDYADRQSFFGIDIHESLPFQILKGWHLQLAIAWIAAAWLAAGLFIAPFVGRREPRRQRLLANTLWVAVVVVVLGSLAGVWLGVKDKLGDVWWWFGNQGLEYIQLGRGFQIALFAGLAIWVVILARAFWPGLRERRDRGSVEHLLLYSGAAIAFVYVFGMLPVAEPLESATMTDYWRWWVVHLWVEGAFEFFTVAVTGYAVLSMGLLSRRFVERIVLFELILIFGTGIVGTGHHFYWAGEPSLWLGLGGTFSMLEVIPLGVLMVRAWQEYRAVRAAGESFPQRTAFMYFTSAAVWNVLGAGVLGAIINPPAVNYYAHGSFLTLAHGHAAMFGTFGLLAIGLMYLTLRGLTLREFWRDRLGLLALRAFNAAIVLWLALNLIPIGVAQFVATVDHGYFFARSLDFYDDWTVLQWLRLPGDVAFLAGGALIGLDLILKLRHRRRPTVKDGEAFDVTPPRPRPAAPIEPPARLRAPTPSAR